MNIKEFITKYKIYCITGLAVVIIAIGGGIFYGVSHTSKEADTKVEAKKDTPKKEDTKKKEEAKEEAKKKEVEKKKEEEKKAEVQKSEESNVDEDEKTQQQADGQNYESKETNVSQPSQESQSLAQDNTLYDEFGNPLPPNCVSYVGGPEGGYGLDAAGNIIGLSRENYGKICCEHLYPKDTYECIPAYYTMNALNLDDSSCYKEDGTKKTPAEYFADYPERYTFYYLHRQPGSEWFYIGLMQTRDFDLMVSDGRLILQ